MPRTWSNVKYVETRSAAQRLKNRPSSLTLFLHSNRVLPGSLLRRHRLLDERRAAPSGHRKFPTWRIRPKND